MNILLFDIDGTLLLSGGAGNRAMDRAYSLLYGIQGATRGRDFSGMTDPVILRSLFSHFAHREGTREEMKELAKAYLRFLEEEVKSSPGFRVLPGVPDLLQRLSERKDVLLGIATGNLKPGARIKLKRANLLSYFRFGAYGSDSEHRPAIVALGIERARKFLTGSQDAQVAYVVGDTPLDIEAGKAAGTLTVAVASGTKSAEELRRHQPTYLLPDFSNPADFLGLLS
ncbi:MAG: HAD family hydrolase [candidate division NC10 bacterium]|nr:HAD family hydrolase [candidate division NC10 bacterium]